MENPTCITQGSINPRKTKTNQTKLSRFVRGRSKWKLSNFWDEERKSWTHLPFSFHLINTRNKKIKLLIHPASSFCSATSGTKKNSSTKQIRLTRVTNIRQMPIKLHGEMLPSRCVILAEAVSIAPISLQQRQSISLASLLQCPHLHQSRFPILILYAINGN